jgi:hypothetical protein
LEGIRRFASERKARLERLREIVRGIEESRG